LVFAFASALRFFINSAGWLDIDRFSPDWLTETRRTVCCAATPDAFHLIAHT
jgi:hypothetical protein